jgi:cytochrome c
MTRPTLGFTFILALLAGALIIAVAADLGLRGMHRFPSPPVQFVPDGNPQLGRAAFIHHGCTGCHTIPGIREATGRVGPQLHDFAEQIYIAGHLANTPDNLIFWIQHPKHVAPGTAMPDLGVTEEEAKHIAAYIYAATARRQRLPEGP